METNEENKFYYQGKYFSKQEDFLEYVQDFTFRDIDQESFNSLFDMLKKDIWMNLHIRNLKLSNGALREILEESFIYIMNKFFHKKNKNEKLNREPN